MPDDEQEEYPLGGGDYSASLTKAHFMFYEMRVTASLLASGMRPDAARQKIVEENLYQYPTLRSLKTVAGYCLSRLAGMGSDVLVEAVASGPSSITKQVCLYAMMKQSRLMYEFMQSVIADKYRHLDYRFSPRDVTDYFQRLQEQSPYVASWSTSTIAKLKSVVTRALVECGYIESSRSNVLAVVTPAPILEQVIRSKHENSILPVFHTFS